MPDRSERIHASYDMRDPLKWGLEPNYSRETSALGVVTVPAGFIWDGASTPRFMHTILPPWGMYSGAALVHDFLYSTKPCTREQADRVLLQLMIEDGVRPERATVMYRAVQALGQDRWDAVGAASA